MAARTISPAKVVSRQEWLSARRALFLEEKEITHKLDELRKRRRQLPWVKIEKPYVFKGPNGKCTLADLFQGPANSPSITSCSRRAPITFAKGAHSSLIISTRHASTLTTPTFHLL